jgi:hypothetical protein
MESNGYATAASSIAQDPDKETYVFRRFDRLTARNLLNLQGELLALQISKGSQDRNGEEEIERLEIAGQLEEKLRKYRECAGIGN